jgi:hypothetical protein
LTWQIKLGEPAISNSEVKTTHLATHISLATCDHLHTELGLKKSRNFSQNFTAKYWKIPEIPLGQAGELTPTKSRSWNMVITTAVHTARRWNGTRLDTDPKFTTI